VDSTAQVPFQIPRLAILMVEEAAKEHESYPMKKELWNSLPRKIRYRTFNRILDYLESAGKILVDQEGSIVWTFPDNEKLEMLLKSSTKLQ